TCGAAPDTSCASSMTSAVAAASADSATNACGGVGISRFGDEVASPMVFSCVPSSIGADAEPRDCAAMADWTGFSGSTTAIGVVTGVSAALLAISASTVLSTSAASFGAALLSSDGSSAVATMICSGCGKLSPSGGSVLPPAI